MAAIFPPIRPPQSAPAGMGRRHYGACPIAEQHRQAVGSHHDAGLPRLMRTGGIGIRYALITVAHRMDGDAMYLVEPVESAGIPATLQSGRGWPRPWPVHRPHGPRGSGQQRPLADAAVPGGRERSSDIARCGPVGVIQFICGSFRSYENGAPWLQPVKGPASDHGGQVTAGIVARPPRISSRPDRPDWPGYPPAALPSAPPCPAAWGVPPITSPVMGCASFSMVACSA